MIDIISFIKANFNTENSNIIMFDVPAKRFTEFNVLYGTNFQGAEGICRVRISIDEFIKYYIDVFRDVTDRHSTFDIFTKLLHYDERKGIGNAPFFRKKIFESLAIRRNEIRLLGQKPAGKLPDNGHKMQQFVPGLR